MDDLAIQPYPQDIVVMLSGTEVVFNQGVSPPAMAVYSLLNDANSTSEWVTVTGGSYVWSAIAAAFNGATLSLQAKGPDAVTILFVEALVANGSQLVNIGEGTQIRIEVVGGVPEGVFSDLRAFSQ